MRHLSHKIHLYLSIPFGLLITVICATGAMLALKDDIIRLLNLDYYYAGHVTGKPQEVDALVGKVIETLPDSVKVAGVEISSDPRRSYGVKLSDADKSTVFIDPYTGEILGTKGETKFFATVKRLHRTLLDSRPAAENLGKRITGINAIAFTAIIITGLCMWLPTRRRRNIRHTLRHPIRSGFRKVNMTLHGAAGTCTSIFLLTISLTGLTWSFEWYRIAFYNIFGAEAPVQKTPTQPVDLLPDDPELSREILHGWTRAFHHLEAASNGYDLVALSPHRAIGYYLSEGNTRASDFYTFEDDGEIKTARYYRDAKPDTKLRGWIYSVHTGSFGGIATRILWALAAFTGAMLPLGGYIIWWRRVTRLRGAHRYSDGCNKARKNDSR